MSSPHKDNIHVRTGEPDDEAGIMTLARTITAENGVFAMDDDKVRAMIRPSLYLDGGIIGIIGRKNAIEGLVILRISNYWYSSSAFVEELLIYVHPDHRAAKGGRARKLVEFAKNVATQLGLPLMVGVLNNARTDAKVKLYERQFGAPAGAFFLWGVKTGMINDPDIVTGEL